MSKDTHTSSREAYIAYVKQRMLNDYDKASPETRMKSLLPAIMAKAGVLKMLVTICEDPGKTKNQYAGNDRSLNIAVEVLKSSRLVEERRAAYCRYGTLFPTEDAKSVYIGMWFAANRSPLLPRMESRNMITPPAFWEPYTTYHIKKGHGNGEYLLCDAEAQGRHRVIFDVFIDPDGDMWYSVNGISERQKVDVEEDVDTMDPDTQECLKEIVEVSKKRQAEMAKRTYDDLVNFD